jgi:hypothetical protein
MKKILLISCIGSFCWLGSLGQSAWKFRSCNYVGILSGEAGNYGQLQSINGLYKRVWFVGVGAGLDYYRFRSIPLFASVTRDLLSGKHGLYVTGDAGTNIPWYKRPSFGMASTFHAGLYWSGSLGYRFRISQKGQALLLSVGYSYKELSEDVKGYWAGLYRYHNDRASIKIGWRF